MKTNPSVRFLPTLLLLYSVLISPPWLSAQGTAFTYQGELIDNGHPANGSYDLTFALFNAAAGGTQMGDTLTNGMTAISNGLFTVTLDFGGGVFDGSDRWLEIGVATNGSGVFINLSPRLPITATPYATRSANSGSALGVSGPVSAAQLTGTISPGNIGAGSITRAMLAAGSVGSNQLAVGAVTTTALADGAVSAVKLHSISYPRLLTVITNPTPASSDEFGISVSAVGSGLLLVGDYLDDHGAIDAGSAYLFNLDGSLLLTITNPSPAFNERFGYAVAGLGSDRLLVGAPRDDNGTFPAGAAFLYSTNGQLLLTITNPAPDGTNLFGLAIASVGTDRILIGAPHKQSGTGSTDLGTAYLFDTNGTLLVTYTNPGTTFLVPNGAFGTAVAALDPGRVVIGAPSNETSTSHDGGVVYVFGTNGSLLASIPNPQISPVVSSFGFSVAAFGGDEILIGAPGNLQPLDFSSVLCGAAYLYLTNGTLSASFDDPQPANNNGFGTAVAAIAPNQILISAPASLIFTNASFAYLFITNGTLLTRLTFSDPVPEPGEGFGASVAAFGADKFLIGAPFNDTGGLDSGLAFLFSQVTYSPGVVGESVAPGAITTEQLADGSITGAKLAPDLGFWSAASQTLTFANGNIGIGNPAPATALDVGGTVRASSFQGDGAAVTNINLLAADSHGAINWETNYPGIFSLAASPSVCCFLSSVTSADVNGDGRMDLISANNSVNTVSVLLNAGDGTFVISSSPTVGDGPLQVIAPDVNGDGRPDLVTANSQGILPANTLTVLTNDGTGDFVFASSPAVGSGPRSVAAADFNSDGTPDLVSADFGASPNFGTTLTIVTNDGSGSFGSNQSLTISASPLCVIAADLNSDGKPDIICGDNLATLLVFTNNGTGGFALLGSFSVGPAPESVTAADVNGDGRMDLISAGNAADTLTVLTNTGNGNFLLASSPAVGHGPTSVVTADINHDARLDLICANAGFSPNFTNTLTVLTNTGAGTFGLAVTLTVGSAPSAVIAADVNNDGQPDLVSANQLGNSLSVLINTPQFNATFNGNGSTLRNLNADQLASGTIGDARLSTNVALLNADQSFRGVNDFNNPANRFAGNGSALTALDAGHVASGTLADARLSSNVDLLNSAQTFSATKAFSGLTQLLAAGGTATGPGIAFNGNPNTGMFLPLVNNVAIASAGVERLRVTSTGSVGIGTTAPEAPLHVASGSAGAVTANGNSIAVFEKSGNAYLSLLTPATNESGLVFGTPNADTDGAIVFNNTSTSHGLQFRTGTNTTRMVILANGNVGVGTSTPDGPLEVHTPAGINANMRLTSGGSWPLVLDQSPSSIFSISNGGQARITLLPAGNVGIGTNNPTVKLHVIGNILASGTITGSSDRNVKQNFAKVDPQEILAKVAGLPITTWQYKADQDGERHLGPMAQDFYGAFHVGMDDKHISMVDADGVALAAIQGLNQKLETRDKRSEVRIQRSEGRIDELKTENANLQAEVADLRSQLDRLQKAVAHLAAKSSGGLALNTQSQDEK